MNVVVGITGGIAAYKAVLVVRGLMAEGASVRVIMTAAATRFVGPVTLTGLTGQPPVTDLWDPTYAGEIHVELAEWATVLAVVPATAHLIARAAQGMADDALTATLLCFDGPVVMAPAMHTRMWNHPATQRNVSRLAGDGVTLVGPVEGALASGDVGLGRLSEPDDIIRAVRAQGS